MPPELPARRSLVELIAPTQSLVLRASPPQILLMPNIDLINAPIPPGPQRVRLSATVATRFGSATFETPEIFSNITARFTVARNLDMVGFAPVDSSGDTEIRPARWTWAPPSAGFYFLNAVSTNSDGHVLAAAIRYFVPIDVTLRVSSAPNGVRVEAAVRNPIRNNSVPGISPTIRYLFTAKRTDDPTADLVARTFNDPDHQNPVWAPRLGRGLYKLYCAVFQVDSNAGTVAFGQQIVIGHQVFS